MIRVLACGFVLLAALLGPSAVAADLPSFQSSDYDPSRDGVTTPQGSADIADGGDIELSLELPSFFATADGPRMEGSASLIRQWKVPKSSLALPEMRVTLNGHIIKTADTVARIDVQFGETKRSFTWASGEVKSGRFDLTFSEPLPGGKVPRTMPVSAIAFVTKEKPGSVVMVSLESIKMTISSSRVAEHGGAPESTALWPDLAP